MNTTDNPPRRLLFAGEYAGIVGGIERYMAHTARILNRNGFEVAGVFAKEARDADEFRSAFARVYRFDQLDEACRDYPVAVVHRVRSAEEFARLRERARRVVAVVHDHEYTCPRRCRYPAFKSIDCHLAYGKLYCGLCGMTRRNPRGFGAALYENFTLFPRLFDELHHADDYVVLSDFMRRELVRNRFEAARIHVIPPAVAAPEICPGHPLNDPPKLLVTGQLIRGKGVDLLFAALPEIRENFVLDIAGTGNEEARLRELAAPFGDRVRFHGHLAHPEELLAAADLAVLPWRWQEPFGLVGPEALGYGVPLAGFARGGSEEYLIDGETGLTAPPGDVHALAEAISKLLRDAGLRRRCGERGRELVLDKFSETAFVRRFRTLLTTEEAR